MGAGDIPIAMPLFCSTIVLSNRMRLFSITSERASVVAMGVRCGYAAVVVGSRRKFDSRLMQSSVSMFVYIETAS